MGWKLEAWHWFVDLFTLVVQTFVYLVMYLYEYAYTSFVCWFSEAIWNLCIYGEREREREMCLHLHPNRKVWLTDGSRIIDDCCRVIFYSRLTQDIESLWANYLTHSNLQNSCYKGEHFRCHQLQGANITWTLAGWSYWCSAFGWSLGEPTSLKFSCVRGRTLISWLVLIITNPTARVVKSPPHSELWNKSWCVKLS